MPTYSQTIPNYIAKYTQELRESIAPIFQAIHELEALENDILGQTDIEEITIDNEQILVKTYAEASQILVRAARGSEQTSKVADRLYGNIVNIPGIIIRTARVLKERAAKDDAAQALIDAQATQAAQKIVEDRNNYEAETLALKARLGL